MSTSPTLILQSIGNNGTQVSYPLIINPNVTNYNNYVTNQRNFYERTIGGKGWTEDQIANNAIRSRNISLQSGRSNNTNGSFSFNANVGSFFNIFGVTTPTASIPITINQANQIIEFTVETGGIWLQTAPLGSRMELKLERSATSNFTNVTVINNSGNSDELHNRCNSGVGASYSITIEDDGAKPVGTYYYRMMINYNVNGLVSHWNWQGWMLYKVYNSRSTF